MNGYDFALGLLWTLPAVAAASFAMVLLIVRSIVVPTTRASLISASTLFALIPTLTATAFCLAAWVWGDGSADELETSLIRAVPPLTAVSFLVSFIVLHSLFGPDQPSRHVVAAVLMAQFAFATPLLAAGAHPLASEAQSGYAEVAILAFMHALTFAPEVLLIPWLIARFRRSTRHENDSYESDAWVVAGIGILILAWAFAAADFWASKAS